jgi:DNA-binding NarL/FixJ family response regulator
MRPMGSAAERVVALLSSFADLRDNNRVLVEELRDSVDRLRALRQEISRHPAGNYGRGRGQQRAAENLAERFGLTRREEEVALLLAQGKSNQTIARELDISAHTARHHTQRILSKLQVHSRGEAGARIRS